MRQARVQELMEREGIPSLVQLGARTGVHYSTLSLWARGLSNPREDLRERVCRAFDGRYSEDWLFPRVNGDAATLPPAAAEAMAV